MKNKDIAIVGMSIFCPAGESIEEFWHGISGGDDFITDAPNDIIESFYFDGEANSIDCFYCKRGGFSKPFKVDPIRYGIMPLAANGIDPDQLIALAGVEHALQDANIFAKDIPLNNCSIIIGKGNYSSLVSLRSLEIVRMSQQLSAILKTALPKLTERDLVKVKEAYQAKQGRYQPDMVIGAMPNLVASLVANRFDMHGPAYTIDAACASGIVAINHSISLIRDGQCDLAVAGAMHTTQSAMFWGAFELLGALSRKQIIAPFSEAADGLLIGHGVGFIVLKSLDRALKDNDRIYALIKETAVCSDGATSHVMVTSVDGQVRVLKKAWEAAGMDPKSIGYVEAHGTGTVVGDRTEITTLANFFGDNSWPRAYVGSVKSNVGHLMPAAGIIGVIKTALSLYHRKIPPTLHCEQPLPAMFESRFMPPQELLDWDAEQLPLIAGVNAFGFGGINAHAIMTAYEPELRSQRRRLPFYSGDTLMLSAQSGDELIRKLQCGDYTHTGGNYRLVIFDANATRIQQACAVIKKDKPWHGAADIWFSNNPLISGGGKIVFLFPGLYIETACESASLCDAFDLPYLHDLNGMAEYESIDKYNMLQMRYIEQLCKSALEKLGVEADMYAGHSIGEWSAVAHAGGMHIDTDAMYRNMANWQGLINYPAIAISGMRRSEAEKMIEGIPDIWLASDNCPNQILLIGKNEAVESLKYLLAEQGIIYTIMPFGAGWHTPLAADEIHFHMDFLADVEITKRRLPVWSGTTLEIIPEDKEGYVNLVTEQLTKPVLFRELIEKLYEEQQARIFIQLGYGNLAGFVEDTLKGKNFRAISTCTSLRKSADQLRRVMALLFIEGKAAQAGFMGVKPMYRVENNLITLPLGTPSIIKELPELNKVISERYGDTGVLAGIPAASERLNTNPIAASAVKNIHDAINAQRELTQILEGRPSILGALPDRPASAAKPADEFKEILHLSPDDHPYLLDHSIVRQPAGWPFPEDLNTVVPLAMTLELFAEIALRHAPGKKLQKISNVAAYKWIVPGQTPEIEVSGKWTLPDKLEIVFGGFAKGECTLGDTLPEPPAEFLEDKETDIGEMIMEPCAASKLYSRFSFHGPQYQSCLMHTRICSRGMESTAVKKSGKGSLLDMMGQELGLFLHLTQSKNTISFPVRLKELTFFSDIFDQAGDFNHTLIIKQLTDAIIVGDMILKRDGKIWSLARGFVCQRFENVVSVWNVIVNPQKNKLAEEIAPGVFLFSCEFSDNVLIMLMKRYLGRADYELYDSIKTPQLRRENIISRIALKDGVRSCAAQGKAMLYPVEFSCLHDENGKPYVKGYGRAAEMVDHLHISLAHKSETAIAIVSDRPVGVDLEKLKDTTAGFIKMICTEREIEMLGASGNPEEAMRFWVAKEAYAKMKGTGLLGNPQRFEVGSVEGDILVIENTRIKTMKVGTEYIAGWTI
jgi:3-oxoacyl-(acyl-carrier-protein) synthase/phosphopantetheinyl transferase/malonyl CoA-acyl carrier protein transacylase